MGDLTENFSQWEFNCKCGKCKPVPPDADFLDSLQNIRSDYGKPITITSGGRCPDHNKAEGGEPGSSHLAIAGDSVLEWEVQPQGADFLVPGSYERYPLVKLAQKYFKRGGEGKDFIHVDSDYTKPWPRWWTYYE